MWYDGKTKEELHQIVSDMTNWTNFAKPMRLTFPQTLKDLGLNPNWYPDRHLWTQMHNEAAEQIKNLGGN